MDVVEAVVDLAKERDELAHELETYENWFEMLVGREVTLVLRKNKRKTRYITCTVEEFTPGEGWILKSEDDEIYTASFEDFASGHVWVAGANKDDDPEDLRALITPRRRVKFAEPEIIM